MLIKPGLKGLQNPTVIFISALCKAAQCVVATIRHNGDEVRIDVEGRKTCSQISTCNDVQVEEGISHLCIKWLTSTSASYLTNAVLFQTTYMSSDSETPHFSTSLPTTVYVFLFLSSVCLLIPHLSFSSSPPFQFN